MSNPTTTTNTSALLADPILAPFLASSFSTVNYLNTALPPLLPPSIALPASKSDRVQQHLPPNHNPNAVPLSQIHPKTTALLSTLDVHTHRLIGQLQNLTDEILRVTPRLSYEVEVLRGGVVSLGEDLERVGTKVTRFDPSHSAAPTTGGLELKGHKPQVLKRLEMLCMVRTRLEEVIAIFGEAMSWPLPLATVEQNASTGVNAHAHANSPSSSSHLSPAPSPPTFIKELNKLSNAAKAPNKTINPAAEISYLLAANLVSRARERIEELRLLAGVFKGTIEGEARLELVDNLARQVAEAEGRFSAKEEGTVLPRNSRKEEDMAVDNSAGARTDDTYAHGVNALGVGREGYYGLINQLQRMRGMG